MLSHSIWWSQINGGQQPGCSLGGTPSLPHGLVPPIKPPTHSSQAAALWTRESAQQSVLPINSFSTCGVFVQQFLTLCLLSTPWLSQHNYVPATGLSVIFFQFEGLQRSPSVRIRADWFFTHTSPHLNKDLQRTSKYTYFCPLLSTCSIASPFLSSS
jgi:hypothetical protein